MPILKALNQYEDTAKCQQYRFKLNAKKATPQKIINSYIIMFLQGR